MTKKGEIKGVETENHDESFQYFHFTARPTSETSAHKALVMVALLKVSMKNNIDLKYTLT